MAQEVVASETQQALFRKWAQDSVFVLDIHDSTKRQFCLLAKLMGWVGGEEPWNAHWFECFGQVYTWRGPDTVTTPARPALNDALKSAKTSPSTSNTTPTPSDNDGARSSDVWYQFKGFIPNPTASFNNEFWRLTRHMGWNFEERRKQRVKIFDADWEGHIGNELGNLAHWQEFCRLCSVDPIPDTIIECIEELESIFVNIYDLLDSQRTGAAVIPFESFKEFRDYTRHGHMYPIEEAKEDTFLPTFLKKLFLKQGD